MIDAVQIGIVALLAAVGWLVWDTLRAREAANAAMRAACEARGWLFLDDTVALRSMRPVRNDEGHVTLQRIYDFQYSGTGHDRRDGTITLLGADVASLDLAAERWAGQTLQ
jgi:hypothetical protein